METRNILGTVSIAIGSVVLAASPAFAVGVPTPIPEPEALSIYAAGVAGLAFAARFLRRK